MLVDKQTSEQTKSQSVENNITVAMLLCAGIVKISRRLQSIEAYDTNSVSPLVTFTLTC